MKNVNLNDLAVFTEVVRANGFRAAADKLNLAPGSVSEIVQRIESRLGVRLIERTTRKISLTNAGERLLKRSIPALAELEHALNDTQEEQDTLAGTLRLSAPRSSSPFFLDEVITEFASTYPTVDIEIIYNDEKVDLVTSGIDGAIRSQTLLENGSHSVEIGPELEMTLVASPDYFKRKGLPTHPTELTQHDGIRFGFGSADRLAPWEFKDEQNTLYMVTPKPRMIVNDLVSLLHFAQSGFGVTYVYRKPADALIRSGKLISIFDEYIPNLPRYTINYLTKRHMPARLRAFIDLAKRF